MPRKKSLHPSDILRKKQRRKELRKLQKQRQKARNEGLRRLAPEKLLAGIRKFNRLKTQEGGLDERTAVKRKNLVNAYRDVMKHRKHAEAERKKEKAVTITGISKILGVEQPEDTKKQEEKEEEKKNRENAEPEKSDKDDSTKENEAPQQIEDLEFPPGLPRPIHLCPPPGIRPRPQRQIANTAKSDPIKPVETPKTNRNLTNSFVQPQVQLVNLDMGNRKKRKNYLPEDFHDPMNPSNPFFLQHPKQQAVLRKEVKKLERRQRKLAKQNYERSLQTTPQAIVGPLPPTQQDDSEELLPLPEPGEEGGKLEILLPDSMMSLRPTALSVKRYIAPRKKKHRQLELAPDVATNKQQKKVKKGKKKEAAATTTEYATFLAEIEGLL